MKTIKFLVLLLLLLHLYAARGSVNYRTETLAIKNSFIYGMPENGNWTLQSDSPKINPANHLELFDTDKRGNHFSVKSFLNGNPHKSMDEKIKTRTWISGSLFVASFATGYWLSSSDNSPNIALLTVHKLTSASNMAMLDVTLFQKSKTTTLTTGEKIVAILMNAAFVTTIGTGARLSMKKPVSNSIQTVHKITPFVTTISAGTLLYLLNKNR